MSAAPPSDPDAHLREDRLESEPVYRGRLLEVRCDRVRLPDGGEATREYIVHPGAVMVVPLLDDGRLLMERQWRYPLGCVMLEFPAGKLEIGEDPLHCAQRELLEETGYRAAEWGRAGVLHNAIAYSSERIEVWFARGMVAGPQQLDAGEFVELQVCTVDELDRFCAEGQVTDAKTLVGLLWLKNWQSGRWSIPWRAPQPIMAP